MMKKLYTFLVLVLFLPLSTMAQMHYPIRTNTIVTPPVPFSLDGFVSQPGKLMLNVLVDDVTLSQYPVKLQLHIEGNGIRISSNPNIPQQPIYLDGGVTTQLTGSDLEFYFNPENLLFQGYSLNEYRRNGRLPEGVYRIRFEVLDFYRDFKVSSAIPAVAMMSLTNGPVLTFPANRSEIDVDANPVLRFSWMAVFTAIPDALIEYRFKLWQIRPDNRDPFEITKVTTPVYEVDLSETALLYDGSLPPLEKGARYVWQVTALDLSGNVLFKKDGNSDIATFRYGYECAAPSAAISKVSHNSVSVSWNSNSSIREYIVSYRKENDSEWQEVTTSNVGLTIDNLEHSVQYELYVRASCGDASSSNERLLRFKTDRFVDYSCGAGAPRISFENQDPLPALHRFDEFKAADFYIEVTEVSGTQGVFSGRGLASIPFLEFLKFEVSFNDITINTDRQMIDGHVVFLHEEETGKIPGRNMGVGGSQGAEGSQELSFEEALNEIADQKVTIDEEVADVRVSNGNVTVVTESGQTQSYLVGENQTLAIVTPESIVVVDQASGQVFQAPNTPPGSSSNVRTPSQSGIHGCLVTFRPSATQRLGFDAVGNGVVKPNSYFLRDRNGDAVPWKSLEAGNTDYVAMLTNGDCQADSLRFIRESGLLTPTTPGRNNSLELLLTGGFQGQEERLTVARATTNHINDSTSEEILTEAGVLGLVSYQRITRDVFLIPVNGASFPTASTQLSDIEKRLNEIYGSAVINWNVHFDEPIEVGRINEADFKVEGTSMLSKYTSDMNRVIRTYKRNRPSDDNSLYLFFVELSDLGTSRKGFMPLAGNFGFIFNFSASDFDLLAHELAHGAFNLRHTFSDKAQHYFPVQQTANLMDYAGGTDLWKYQWDLIHNPESIVFAWAQDESEGEMIRNEKVTGVWKTVNPPQMYEARPKLTYNKIFVPNDDYIKNTHTLIQLVDGSKFLVSPLETAEVGYTYQIKPPGFDEWCVVYLSWFEPHCLSCELEFIGKELTKLAGTTVGRYILPIEDGYILITGEDFDGNEASRIAAGGFIVLEVIQVGKVFKLVKGAKILTKTGTAVNVSKRVVKQFAKKVSKDAAIDMSIQFVVNFIDEIIQNPNSDGFDLAASAFAKIDIKDAVVTGMIDFASMDDMTKTSFDCALRFFRQFENDGEASTVSIEQGLLDCAIIVGVRYSFKKLKGTEQINHLAKAIADAKNYDVIINKLSQIMSADAVEQYIQTLTEYSLFKGAEVVWE